MSKTDKIYWTMRNGEKIDVDEMTIEHLRNTLKMIIRNDNKRKTSDFDDDFFNESHSFKRERYCDATEIDVY
jgi:hypothetical protein